MESDVTLMPVFCAWCREPMKAMPGSLNAVSHGLCEKCLEKELAKLDEPEIHTRENCRALPYEDRGCPLMMEQVKGEGFACALAGTGATWQCNHMPGDQRRRVVDPELEQGWESVKRYGPSFRRHHGDEAD